MKTVYERAMEAISKGKTFQIDFKKRNLKVNGKYLIKDGKFKGELGVQPEIKEVWISQIEEYYNKYCFSNPGTKSSQFRKRYFLTAEDLHDVKRTDEDWVFGEYRHLSQFDLEFYILCHLIDGSIVWTEDLDVPGWRSGKFFWQNLKNKNLIIKKSWF